MTIAAWNIRGLNSPLKQKCVLDFMKVNRVDVMGVLECKLSVERLAGLMRTTFAGWQEVNNFHLHRAGRILVLWNPRAVDIQVEGILSQVIHLRASCKVTTKSFLISFVYGFHTIINRRELWNDLLAYDLGRREPWMILGDFNSLLKIDERKNGEPVSAYQIKEFLDCCMRLCLVDTRSSGFYFTWSNNTVWSKLDRVMVNDCWVQSDLHVSTVFLPPACSDHCPSVTSFSGFPGGGKRGFMFYNMWLDHTEYESIIRSNWRDDLYGKAQYVLCKRLKRIKGPLKMLNKVHFSHISARAGRAREELETAQLESHDSPGDEGVQSRLKELRRVAWLLSEAERKFYFQKAKCRYIVDADRNTRLFHSVVKRNARKNCITSVVRENGSRTTSMEEVAREFLHYYTQLLGSDSETVPVDPHVFSAGPLVPLDSWESLTSPVTDSEIREHMFYMGADKAPGPDGFTAGFFRRSWDIVGGDVCAAIREFFCSGQLLKQLNHCVIALVPKSAHASSVSDYRPISCCNVVYKVISRILASRMSGVLPLIIDEAQSAFVKGRRMTENIHLAQELISRYGRKRVSPRCIIKVDIRKAYDTVSWPFLRSSLLGLGFPQRFVDWIMECVQTASYSIRINGGVYGCFRGRRGLRQGDPISPYLFVICAEYFSRMAIRATRGYGFNFHPGCGALRITHLAYADDMMLFSRGDPPSVRILWHALLAFGDVSGLRANPNKSSMYMAGVDDRDREEIRGITGI